MSEENTASVNDVTDLASIQAAPRAFEVLHPKTREPIGLRITLLPSSDSAVKKAQRKNLDAQLNSRSAKMSALGVEENNLNVLVAAVKEWDWYGEKTVFEGGKPECTPENIRKVFKKTPWIRDQVKDEFDDSESFFVE